MGFFCIAKYGNTAFNLQPFYPPRPSGTPQEGNSLVRPPCLPRLVGGNVRATVSDIKEPSGGGFTTNTITAASFYPFGFMEEGRFFGSSNRWGFGGHEKDDEVRGIGNRLSFGDYGYDPRKAMRQNIDPLIGKYPGFSSYLAFGDNPIMFSDPDGREIILNGFDDPEKSTDKIFGEWMVSPEGKAYLAQFAKKDQILKVGGKEVKFDKDGDFHKAKIDAVYTTKYMGDEASQLNLFDYEGTKTVPIVGGRYQVEVLFNKSLHTVEPLHKAFRESPNDYTYNLLLLDRLGTIVHENYVHQLFVTEAIIKYGFDWYHKQERANQQDALLGLYSQLFGLYKSTNIELFFHIQRLKEEAFPMLRNFSNNYNLGLTSEDIWNLGVLNHCWTQYLSVKNINDLKKSNNKVLSKINN